MNVIILILSCLINVAYGADNVDFDYETLIEGLKYSEALVLNGVGEMTWHFAVKDSTDNQLLERIREYYNLNQIEDVHRNVKSDIFFAFKGEKVKLEEHFIGYVPEHRGGGIYERIGVAAYDGERNYAYLRHRISESGKKEPFKAYGAISGINQFKNYAISPLMYTYSINSIPFSNIVGQTQSNEFQFMRIEEIDNVQCEVFQYKSQDSDSTITLYLAPEFLYKPTRIIIETMKYKSVINNIYAKYDQDIWFLKNRSNEFYYLEDENQSLLFEETISVSDDYEINTTISDDLFVIQFPNGLRVYNEDTDEAFYVEDSYDMGKHLIPAD